MKHEFSTEDAATAAAQPGDIEPARTTRSVKDDESNPVLATLMGGRTLEEVQADAVKQLQQVHRLMQAGWRPQVERSGGVRQVSLYPTKEELESGIPNQVRRRRVRLRPE